MICPFCHTVQADTTIFCNECGTYLLESDQRGTDPLDVLRVDAIERVDGEESRSSEFIKGVGPSAVRLKIVESGREVEVSLTTKAFHLGCLDLDRDSFPEIDLTDDKGLEKGVSPRHARIARQADLIVVEDLGSLNGTFINGKRLATYLPEVLNHGDQLRLGNVIIEVTLRYDEAAKTVPAKRVSYIEQRVYHLLALFERELYYLDGAPIGKKSLSNLGTVTIGRVADIEIRDARISRQHCRIFSQDSKFFIQDLGSSNGTLINEEKLLPGIERQLHHQDFIKIGATILYFGDEIGAFMDELNLVQEKELVVRSIKAHQEQNQQVALQILARLLESSLTTSEHSLIGEIVQVICETAAKQPLQGINLILQITKAGEKYVHIQVYRALGQLLCLEEETLLKGLELLVKNTDQYYPTLLYWISIEMEAGLSKSFLEACVGLFSSTGYTETNLERLIEILETFRGAEAKEVSRLYQTLLDLLRARTLLQISKFQAPSFLEKDGIPLSHAKYITKQLEKISQLIQKSLPLEDDLDRLMILADTRDLLDQMEKETLPKLREPESNIYAEIFSNWRSVVLAEHKRLRGRAVLLVALLTKKAFYEKQVTLSLKIQNTGQALAENVRVILKALDDYEITQKSFVDLTNISAKGDIQVEFTVCPKRDDYMRIEVSVNWDDAEHEQKSYSFADKVNFVRTEAKFVPIPNSYVAGSPIKRSDIFFGREDVFDFVLENLVTGQKNTLIFHGQRRAGKSSILHQLCKRVLPSEFIPVYVDMQELAGVKTTNAFLARLAEKIVQAARTRDLTLDPPTDFNEQPTLTFDRFLDETENVLGQQRFVVMLDEFELIEKKINEGMDADILPYFRTLMQHRESLIFIFAGTHRLQEMTLDYWSILFSIAQNREISFLSKEDTWRLITQPVKGSLDYDDLTIEKIIRVTHCQPYLVQLICTQLVIYLNRQQRSYATINDLNKVLDETLITAEAYFYSIWKDSTAHQRLIIALLTTLVYPGKETAAYNEIEQGLLAFDITMSDKVFFGALEELCRRDVLEAPAGELRYRFQIDLVRMWVEKNKPIRRVIIEERAAINSTI